MEQITLDTILQTGGFSLVTYLVLQWKREDGQEAREKLRTLTTQVIETQRILATALDRLADTLDRVEDRLTRLELKSTHAPDP